MTAPSSLHQRILDDIGAKILSGEWPPGHRVPFESELTQTYGCSRMTVNKALSQLAKSGLIERRKRSGTFVARPRSQAAVLEIHDIRAEVEALGLAYRYERLARKSHPARSQTAVEQGFDQTALVEIECRHFAGSQPFCLEQRLISLAAVPEAAEERFEEVAPGPWLLRHVPWTAAEHTIRACAADRATAVALGIAANTACLVVERRTWKADLPVTHVRLTYPGGSHAVTARFTPNGK
jgi:GntR family histidine utilization transcriptional repressor